VTEKHHRAQANGGKEGEESVATEKARAARRAYLIAVAVAAFLAVSSGVIGILMLVGADAVDTSVHADKESIFMWLGIAALVLAAIWVVMGVLAYKNSLGGLLAFFCLYVVVIFLNYLMTPERVSAWTRGDIIKIGIALLLGYCLKEACAARSQRPKAGGASRPFFHRTGVIVVLLVLSPLSIALAIGMLAGMDGTGPLKFVRTWTDSRCDAVIFGSLAVGFTGMFAGIKCLVDRRTQ